VKHLFRFLACAALGVIFAACAGSPAPADAAEKKAKPLRFIRSEPAALPAWRDAVPQSSTEIFFVGASGFLASVPDAREAARQDASAQIARFYGQFLQENMNVRSRYAESAGTALENLMQYDSDIASFAQAVVTQISADQYFTEVYESDAGGEGFIVYALCSIPRKKAEEDIRNFARDVSLRYSSLITRQDSFMTALSSYHHVLQTLEKNPLHRAVAAHTGRGGAVNLYDFLVTEMNSLAAGVTFSPVTSSLRQNDEALNMTVRLASPYKTIGPLEVVSAVNAPGGARVSAIVAPDNTVKISVPTGPLNRGRYTVVFELPLKEQYPVIKANPQGSYMFSVSSVNAAVVFEGAAPADREKDLVTKGIQQAIQRYDAPLRLTPDAAEYVIAVDLRSVSQRMPGTRFSVYTCSLSLSLLRNGALIHQSPAIKGDNGMSPAEALNSALAALRNSPAFFRGIRSSLDK
jgi:hypothetical protein